MYIRTLPVLSEKKTWNRWYQALCLPDSLGLGLSLPRFAVGVVGRCGGESCLVFWQVGRFQEWFLDGFLVPEYAADGLVVEELGEFE